MAGNQEQLQIPEVRNSAYYDRIEAERRAQFDKETTDYTGSTTTPFALTFGEERDLGLVASNKWPVPDDYYAPPNNRRLTDVRTLLNAFAQAKTYEEKKDIRSRLRRQGVYIEPSTTGKSNAGYDSYKDNIIFNWDSANTEGYNLASPGDVGDVLIHEGTHGNAARPIVNRFKVLPKISDEEGEHDDLATEHFADSGMVAKAILDKYPSFINIKILPGNIDKLIIDGMNTVRAQGIRKLDNNSIDYPTFKKMVYYNLNKYILDLRMHGDYIIKATPQEHQRTQNLIPGVQQRYG
jgi:hypothetical protein